MPTSQQEEIKLLKAKFLIYYRQLPIQKLAAAHIARSEDTITDWKKADSDFSDQLRQAKADWALDNFKGVKSKEWVLERLMSRDFGLKQPGGEKDHPVYIEFIK